MRRITLFLFAALVVTSVDAASYEQNDGTIVNPIQSIFGGDLSYSGNNLESGAALTGANLTSATLTNANLTLADLSSANLYHATLSHADLTLADLSSAILTYADLTYALLSDANLSDANLSGALLLDATLSGADLSGSILSDTNYGATWTDAFYYTDNEPTWASGMDAAWRTSVGIVERSSLGEGSPVPEPSTLLLALLGLALLPRRRRR